MVWKQPKHNITLLDVDVETTTLSLKVLFISTCLTSPQRKLIFYIRIVYHIFVLYATSLYVLSRLPCPSYFYTLNPFISHLVFYERICTLPYKNEIGLPFFQNVLMRLCASETAWVFIFLKGSTRAFVLQYCVYSILTSISCCW